MWLIWSEELSFNLTKGKKDQGYKNKHKEDGRSVHGKMRELNYLYFVIK